jgi:hypothetical protein
VWIFIIGSLIDLEEIQGLKKASRKIVPIKNNGPSFLPLTIHYVMNALQWKPVLASKSTEVV